MTKENSSDVVIIGGVACGPKTAATLARRRPDLTVTVFQREKNISYGTCGLPYYASGDINSFEDLTKTGYDVPRTPDFFRRTKGFDVITETEVTAIDRENKTVTVTMLDSGKSFTHGYGTLVIATGAAPNNPPFPVPDSSRITHFTRPEDAINFRHLAEEGQVGKALIVGGGFIGCELAESAGSLWGIETILVEKEPQLLPYVLDPEMAAIVERELIRQDIELHVGVEVDRIELDAGQHPVVHIGGLDPINVDYVFLCLGVHPESTLADACGLKLGVTGGIAVDSHLRTSDPDIYAGGDCIETTCRISENPRYIPMGSLANRHGRVIAENIAGNSAEFSGALGAFLVKVFDRNVGSVGVSQQAAEKAGLRVASVWGSFPDKPDYYPEVKTMSLKLVYEISTGRVIGLQAVGSGDICRRIDTASALMQSRATIEDFLKFENGYAPPYSEALDPLHHLAGMAQAQISRGIDFTSPAIRSMPSSDDTIWLDIREPEEIEAQPWPMDDNTLKGKLIKIPLNDLRDHLGDLDGNSPIMLICRRGPRSYQASVILHQAGFKRVYIIGGGYQAAQG
jgi:NADPH-dependent 2,4-dienoyl-CoA reductase/sulfur reductase-like enzyme/rhodanese-related sulfurtransferase